MKTSVIKVIKPKVTDKGYHEKFTGNDGTDNFVFTVKMEDGTEGECSSRSNKGKYHVGQKVKYETKATKKGTWVSIKGTADDAGSGGGAYNDPTRIKKTAMAKAFELVSLLYKTVQKKPAKPKSVVTYAELFYDWLMAKGQGRDDMYNRYSCLKCAVECAAFDTLIPADTSERHNSIMELAEEFYDHVDEIKEQEKVQEHEDDIE